MKLTNFTGFLAGIAMLAAGAQPQFNRDNIVQAYQKGNDIDFSHTYCDDGETEVIVYYADTDNDRVPDISAAYKVLNDKRERMPFGYLDWHTNTVYLDYNRDGKIDNVRENVPEGSKSCDDMPGIEALKQAA